MAIKQIAPRESHPSPYWWQAAQCFEGVQCGRIIIPAWKLSPMSCLRSFFGTGVDRSFSTIGNRGAPAVWFVSYRTYPFCLMLRGSPRFLFQKHGCLSACKNLQLDKLLQTDKPCQTEAWKGNTLLYRLRFLYRSKIQKFCNEFSFQPSSHILVHTHMKIAVSVVKPSQT